MYLAGIGPRAEQDPHRLAVRDRTGDLSWSRLANQVRAVAGRLLAADDGRSRVGVTGENAAATLVTHLAGLLTGVGTVALHRQGTPKELAQELTDTGCTVAVTGAGSLPAVLEAAAPVGLHAVIVHGTPAPEPALLWEDWVNGPEPEFVLEGRPARPVLVFTSGTTGRAGATEVSWVRGAGASDARAYVEEIAAESGFPDGPHLVVGPLQHNGPLTSLRHLLSGQPVLVLDRFDAEEVLRLVQEFGVTSTVMVPTHFTRLLALDESVRVRYDVRSLRLVAHTGSTCPEPVKRAMIDWWGPVFVEAYGGSELGTVCRIDSREWLAHPGSVGRAVPPLIIESYDEAGRAQPRGTAGVLGITLPPGRAVRFLGDGAKSAKAYLAPGVATLGDVGHVDAEGFVFITDRVSDMVVSGGVNLYPAECEQVLIRHPDVREVAVIGVPDPDLGEALLALIVPVGPLDAAELDRFCRTELAGYKCPRSYRAIPDLTRDEMSKVDKRALRAPYWSSQPTMSEDVQ
ncbi:MAG TPA: AMP-binding protein [Sporichthyaceae bacterium]|jgi:long-chain acyl-CoA synthetase|nr:AMP-binding protein [Sporichthyaceae bacterium]